MYFIPSLILILTILSLHFKVEVAGHILTGLMIFLASYIYYLTTMVFVGVKQIIVNFDPPLNLVWQTRIGELIGITALYVIGSEAAFYYCLPFAMITFFIDLLSSLVKLQFLAFNAKDDEDEGV